MRQQAYSISDRNIACEQRRKNGKQPSIMPCNDYTFPATVVAGPYVMFKHISSVLFASENVYDRL